MLIFIKISKIRLRLIVFYDKNVNYDSLCLSLSINRMFKTISHSLKKYPIVLLKN